ncbi:MAG: NfeD family protein [Bauldia sp.]
MDLRDTLAQLGPWIWVIGGLILLALELVLPGAFFIWFGISAIVVGAASILFDIAWQAQVVAFGVLALILVMFLRPYFNRPRATGSDAALNDRAARLLGTSYVLSQPIVNGTGRVRIGDANWLIAGPDVPSGTRVRVVGADGSILRVEPLAD